MNKNFKLTNCRWLRLEGSEQRVQDLSRYPFIASCLKRGAAAFTLVEMLITIAVIGVVAALIFPTIITTINNKFKNLQTEVIEKKTYRRFKYAKFTG